MSVREIDANMLLAVLAANKGHQVLISDLSSIDTGLKMELIAPGIFNTKSLTPNDWKIKKHKTLKEKGFIITSNDQEAGLSDIGYEENATIRFSEQTISQASAIFGWGEEDVEILKEKYQKYSSKIFKTGSPRSDLWKSIFKDYWGKPSREISNKPYLLVVSNMGLCDITSFPERIEFLKDAGYDKRDPEAIKSEFQTKSDEYRKAYSFIEAINYIVKNNQNKFDIIFRPHPVEDIEGWKILLKGMSNVKVILEGSITKWVNNSFAVMHNGCTTAIEASISGKPVITYDPFNPPMHYGKFANKLGHKISTLEDLLENTNLLFDNFINFKDQKYSDRQVDEELSKKVYLDESELAAEKIIKIWEDISNDDLSKSSNWKRLKWVLKIKDIRDTIRLKLKRLFPNKFSHIKENLKFPPIDSQHTIESFKKLKYILKIDEKVECKFISNRAILIKKP